MNLKNTTQPHILHVSKRETLLPLRDQILRLSGFSVDSTLNDSEALTLVGLRPYTLALIDVEGDAGIHAAESLCSAIKTLHPEQMIAFICNWRVAALTDCPDEILRTEFDPVAFVKGVRDFVAKSSDIPTN